jgi:hypothetical protein
MQVARVLALLAVPVALARLLPLGNIGANFEVLYLLKNCLAVISLVRN